MSEGGAWVGVIGQIGVVGRVVLVVRLVLLVVGGSYIKLSVLHPRFGLGYKQDEQDYGLRLNNKSSNIFLARATVGTSLYV